MLSLVIFFLIYLIVFALAGRQMLFYSKNITRYQHGHLSYRDYWIVSCALIFVCTFKGSWLPDTQPYIDSFYYGDSRMEFMWSLFRSITLWTGTPTSIFFIYSVIAVSLTIRFIRKYCNTPILSLLVWMSYIFIIQDMIQIRQGVASAIFLNTIPFIQEKNWKKFFGFNFIGVLFHISALTVLPLYFISVKKIHKNIFLWMIPACYFLYFAKLGLVFLIQYIQIDFIQALWITKSTMLDVTEGVNLFNIRQLILVTICIIIWLNIGKIKRYSTNSILYIKIFTIAISSFIILFDVPDIASRINVIYSVSEIIAIPALLYIPRQRIYGKIIVLGISLLFFSTYYTRFVLP